jgi:hypothetical protein
MLGAENYSANLVMAGHKRQQHRLLAVLRPRAIDEENNTLFEMVSDF